MVRSMTGFGRCEQEVRGRRICVEIKAVNHRYLDLSIKCPRSFNAFESRIRTVLKDYMERGKTDVYISYERLAEDESSLHCNKALAAQYLRYMREMAEEFGLSDEVHIQSLARFPEVFRMEESAEDEEETWCELKEVLVAAAVAFADSRAREGEVLKEDLLRKLDEMRASREEIVKRSPKLLEEYREKLTEKVRELLGDAAVDENRLLTETAIYADKVCVDEEMVRLNSHILAMREELERGGAVGRKLDFIAQEMNREANTTLSKANDISIADAAIELKTCIEKIREQVQNLE